WLAELNQPSANNYQCTPQPCWHGIHPGITPIEEAEALIRSDKSLAIDEQSSDRSFGELCWRGLPSTQERGCFFRSWLPLSFPTAPSGSHQSTFGDAVNMFGAPTAVQVCYDVETEHKIFVALYFGDTVYAVGRSFDLSRIHNRISLDTPIDFIAYSAQANAMVK